MTSSLEFQKISSIKPAVKYLSDAIGRRLEQGRKVLWLVPGGSATKIAVETGKSLPVNKLKNLSVTLTDERYGPIGHPDSNWLQLEKAGFKLDGAVLRPVLAGLSLEETAHKYSEMVEMELRHADYSIALAGLGADGHILGIKPNSPVVSSDKLAEGYEWDDFRRLTLSSKAIERLDEVVIYAVGEEKWPQIDKLSQNLAADEQPAQLLKKLNRVIIFNDYRGNAE